MSRWAGGRPAAHAAHACSLTASPQSSHGACAGPANAVPPARHSQQHVPKPCLPVHAGQRPSQAFLTHLSPSVRARTGPTLCSALTLVLPLVLTARQHGAQAQRACNRASSPIKSTVAAPKTARMPASLLSFMPAPPARHAGQNKGSAAPRTSCRIKSATPMGSSCSFGHR